MKDSLIFPVTVVLVAQTLPSTLTNATQQIPGFDGNGTVSTELVMTNLGIPLTGSIYYRIYERMM